MDQNVTCFNRDLNGRCLAYTKGVCSWKCSARIANVHDKIVLLESLLDKSQAKKDRRKIEEELEAARKVERAQLEGKLEGWMSCYLEDLHRGGGGGASEGDSNRATAMKQLMKDNRGVKPSREETAEYKEELTQFEEAHGKLERLGRTGMSSSRINSYTGMPVCYINNGSGTCPGEKTKAGTLKKICKDCLYRRKKK